MVVRTCFKLKGAIRKEQVNNKQLTLRH